MARTLTQRFAFGRLSQERRTIIVPRERTIFVARVLLSLIFILGGISKIFSFDTTADYMASKGLVAIPLLLTVALIIEIVGGLAILTGTLARPGAVLLFLYLIPVTLIMHDFWAVDAAARQAQMVNFLKNLAVMGGLLMLAGYGPGRISVDERWQERVGTPPGRGTQMSGEIRD